MKTALFALALLTAGTSVAAADPWDHRGAPPPPPPAYGAPFAHGDNWRDDEDRYNRGDAFRYGYEGRDGYEHRRFIQRGDQLTPWQYRRAEFVGDFWRWRLPPPPRGAAWMRLGDRLMLVRQGDWRVLDVFRV